MMFTASLRFLILIAVVAASIAGCGTFHPRPSRGETVVDQTDLAVAASHAASMLACYIEHEEMPGLSFAIMHKGELVSAEGFGWADLEQNVPVTTDTRFRLASVSKLFTAAAIAKLSEQGQLDLDKPIRTYVPEYPEKQWPITARQIAAHISGIRGYKGEDFTPGQDIHQRKFSTTAEALTIFADDPLLFEPGTQYQYSTFGFTLLTAAIENVSGRHYEDFLRNEILAPLGVQSVIPDRPEQIVATRSRFYEPTGERMIENASPIRSDFKFGGGGLLGTATDLARFGAAHIKPGLFMAQTLEQDLFVEQSRTDGRSVNIGLAWRVGIDEEFGTVYHHSGALPGARSVLMVWPDDELVLAATSNATNAPYYAEEFAQTLSHVFLLAIDGADLSINQNYSRTHRLIFSDADGDHSRDLTLSPSSCSGSLQTPPNISKELKKRGYPEASKLRIAGIYRNSGQSISVILASDIGLHRLQLADNVEPGSSGFVVELANKFEWDVTTHQFTVGE